MSGIEPEVWGRLEPSRPTGENLTARAAVPVVTERLLCAVDAEGHRHLLIPLLDGESELRDTKSRGLTVQTQNLVVRGQDEARYLDIRCEDAGGHPAFDLIGGEIAAQFSAGDAAPAEIVSRVLAKWRRFWGQLPREMLTREGLLGVFAEVWFLSVWLLPRVGAAQAILRWRGPFGSRHDFEWTGESVEVKATTATRGLIHHISGLDQLGPPENGELFLFSLRLREEAGATNTLPTLIANCRTLLGPDAETLGHFETALMRAGYSPVHDEEYAKVHLRVVEEGLFAVRGDFPRLTARSFPDGIPSGVERIEYEINLNTFNHLRVAQRAEEWQP
ncbi:MAG: hypothetical protein AUJ92_16035 [Armatimonadetes bacterium CG2_30_59_28]|nr:PD-(D/E)XK motif protein [Armatimonadota bacterium]OIO91695.1 MAG: hypothetical protein AUJ92_16035 [Armatimonadetes bacterium CG2_30_59_28]